MSETPSVETPITTEQLGEIVRIVDPELDVESILAEIRANLAKRPRLDPDPSSFVYRPGDAASMSGEVVISWHVDQAAEYARSLAVGDQMRPGAGRVGQLADRVKRPLHQLVRFYVDLLAQRQEGLQGHVVEALRGLATRSTAADDELKQLRTEVSQLRDELRALRGETAEGASS